MAKQTKPKGAPAPAPETAKAAAVSANQQPEPQVAKATTPQNRVKPDADDLVEVESVWQDGVAGPGGTVLMPGQRGKLPSAEAQALLLAGRVVLPSKAKGD